VVGLGALLALLRAGWKEGPGARAVGRRAAAPQPVDFSLYAPEVVLPWAVLAGALAGRLADRCAARRRRGCCCRRCSAGWCLSTLAWRAEAEGGRPRCCRAATGSTPQVAAAGWAPWTVTPLLVAAGEALDQVPSSEDLVALDAALAARWWVQPRSAAGRGAARLLLAADRPG